MLLQNEGKLPIIYGVYFFLYIHVLNNWNADFWRKDGNFSV
jgi:hypothetical protein